MKHFDAVFNFILIVYCSNRLFDEVRPRVLKGPCFTIFFHLFVYFFYLSNFFLVLSFWCLGRVTVLPCILRISSHGMFNRLKYRIVYTRFRSRFAFAISICRVARKPRVSRVQPVFSRPYFIDTLKIASIVFHARIFGYDKYRIGIVFVLELVYTRNLTFACTKPTFIFRYKYYNNFFTQS